MSVSAIALAQSVPPGDRLAALLAVPEDQWFDRKSGRIAPKDLARALAAFANAEGGTVIVGLHGGRYDGAELTVDKENALRQASIDFTHPPVRVHTERLDLGDGRSVLRFDIPVSEHVHETSTGEVYLRVGDESKRLSYAQRRELDFDRGSAHFEGEAAPGADAQDLDLDLLAEYRSSVGSTGSDETALRARSLLTRDGSLTHAAALLLAKDPQQWLPQASVRVLRFTSDQAGTGRRLTLEAGRDERFDGPIPSVIASASRRIAEWMPQHRALGNRGRFENIDIIPADAWLEGLVNAVVHRSYSMAGDHIRVNIHPGRIEIESPGRFPGLADPHHPLEIARYARNPRIARVCSDLGITQERGEGIRRMFEEMRVAGLQDPTYEQTSGSVRLLLRAEPSLSPQLLASLPSGGEEILRILREHDAPMGTGDIIDASGRSRPYVRTALAGLREAGLISWRGTSARDPRATWEIVR